MRMIDADELENEFGISDADIIAKEAIRDAPTIDAVHVVRCKDCRHWDIRDGNDTNKRYFCNVDGMWCKPARSQNDFCSYGERKEGAE